MRVEVAVPDEHLGAVLADLQTRGGSVEALGTRAGARAW